MIETTKEHVVRDVAGVICSLLESGRVVLTHGPGCTKPGANRESLPDGDFADVLRREFGHDCTCATITVETVPHEPRSGWSCRDVMASLRAHGVAA